MTLFGVVLWILALVVTAAALAGAVEAVRRARPLLALPALVPVVIGVLLLASGIAVPAVPALPLLLATLLFGLGVVAGGPLTMAVLERVSRGDEEEGAHGGILVRAEGIAGGSREIMRGGGVIGYLERIAVVGAIAAGHPEALVVVVAIKGLGRFSELDTSEARERFIIGTLVSLIWASTCGGLIWLGLR